MDPECDLLDRYDRMVQTQLELLTEVDRKAATVMRIVSLLLGVLLAGAALVVDLERPLSGSTTGIAWIGIGLLCLLCSLLFAVITSVSSDVLHGPHEGVGLYLADHEVEDRDYTVHLLSGYSTAIHYNRIVIKRNAIRLSRGLQALVIGMLGVSTGVLFLVVGLPFVTELIISGLSVVAALVSGKILMTETIMSARNDY